jgi:hypothetical protein
MTCTARLFAESPPLVSTSHVARMVPNILHPVGEVGSVRPTCWPSGQIESAQPRAAPLAEYSGLGMNWLLLSELWCTTPASITTLLLSALHQVRSSSSSCKVRALVILRANDATNGYTP